MARGPRVASVATLERLDTREHLLARLKGEQPRFCRQEATETGLLGAGQTVGGQVADALPSL